MIKKVNDLKNELFMCAEEADVFFDNHGLQARLSIADSDVDVFNNSLAINLGDHGEIELGFDDIGDLIKKPNEDFIEYDFVDNQGEDIMQLIINKGMDV